MSMCQTVYAYEITFLPLCVRTAFWLSVASETGLYRDCVLYLRDKDLGVTSNSCKVNVWCQWQVSLSFAETYVYFQPEINFPYQLMTEIFNLISVHKHTQFTNVTV